MGTRARPLAVHVVLETSCLFTDAADKLIRQELSEFILATADHKEFGVTWHLPAIVRLERKHQMTLRAQRLIPQLEKVESLLGHSFGISKEILDERVDAVIAREIQRHELQLRELDVSKVDWTGLIARSVQRRPPFDPGEKEKGFRDAVALETFCQVIDDLPKSPQSARIVLMSGDQLLIEAARERVGTRSNVAFTSELEDIRSMLNALASALTQEVVEKIVPAASAMFFKSGNKDTLYYKADISSQLVRDFSKELNSRPNAFTASNLKNILINAPAFLAKSGQRLTFSSRITFVSEATKIALRYPTGIGGSGLANSPSGGATSVGSGAPAPMGLLSGLGALPGNTGPTYAATASAGISGPVGPSGPISFGSLAGPTGPTGPSGTSMWGTSPHVSNPLPPPPIPEEIRRRGDHVFEVIWSATLTASGALRNPKVERMEYKTSTWEEEP